MLALDKGCQAPLYLWHLIIFLLDFAARPLPEKLSPPPPKKHLQTHAVGVGCICPKRRRRRKQSRRPALHQNIAPRSARLKRSPAASRRGVPTSGIFAKISPSGVVNILHNKTFFLFWKHLMGGTKCRPVHLRKCFCRLRRICAAFCCPARPAPPAALQLFLGKGEVRLRSPMFFDLREAQRE